jgi:3-hydroxyisobutyrate dehydrogenase-like beta-hydroxyacid dehydrogenase
MTEPIGFVGAGAMGGRMVLRLLTDGHEVLVWARTPEKAHPLADAGARVVTDLAALSAECPIVLGCLLDDRAVTAVYGGAGGLVTTARAGQLFVEHGTFSPRLARELATTATARGARFVDAPVTGGPEGAAAGELVAMAGGAPDALAAARGPLRSYTRAVHEIGGPGSGLDLKLVNQLLVSVHMSAAAEAAALLTAAAIPLEVALPVLSGGWAASTMLDRELPRALSDDLASTGATIGGLIDVQELVADAFAHARIRSHLLPSVRRLFTDAVAAGWGELDPAALIGLYRAEARS